MSINETNGNYTVNGIKNGNKKEVFVQHYVNKAFENTEDIEDVTKGDENSKDDEKKDEGKKDELPPVSFITLFRYSSACDKMLIIFATIIAVASGCSMPGVMIVLGKVIENMIQFDAYNNNITNATITKEDFLNDTKWLCIFNVAIGCAIVCCNYICVCFFNMAAANQAFKIRCMFMSSVLKQDISWYDTHETGDFASRITGDLSRVQDGIGEKVGICISLMSSTFICIGVGLYYGWKLGLVILSMTPLTAIAMAIMAKVQASVSREEMQAYGKAAAIAEEVLSSIRTVCAFGGEIKEIQRYENQLTPARKKGIRRGLWTSIGASITWFTIFAGYALAFWYGVQLILDGLGQDKPEYTGGTLIIVK